jgi:alpha-amylase
MSNDPSFNMANLDHAGLAGVNPFRAMTFVENHDTESRRDLVAKNIQPEDKPLAYAYILTSEGLPCVFYKDYCLEPGCLGGQLRPIINNLVWIHQNIASGPTQQRWKDHEVFVFERTGGARLLVAMNKNKNAARTLSGVNTGFGSFKVLHDYTGHAGDITTDAAGRVTLTIPRNAGGQGYVCYSIGGIGDQFSTGTFPVTQVFEGAPDLDIRPADNGVTVNVCRLWAATGTQIVASLMFDDSEWTSGTCIILTILDPAQKVLTSKPFAAGNAGSQLTASVATGGWHTFTVLSQKPPRTNPNPPYKLTVTYSAPID